MVMTIFLINSTGYLHQVLIHSLCIKQTALKDFSLVEEQLKNIQDKL